MDLFAYLLGKKQGGGGGVEPSGTIEITENGTYDVEAFKSAEVNVSGGGSDDIWPKIVDRTVSGTLADSTISNIGTDAFAYCSALTAVSFPNVTAIRDYAFTDCSALTSVNFPNAITIEEAAFINCSALTSVSFPNVTLIGLMAFAECLNLTTVSFPNAITIEEDVFARCRVLRSAYFLTSTVPTLYDPVAAFLSTPIAGYTDYTSGQFGSIYVKASLYDAFRSSAAWAYYASRIVSMTDEEIEALG